MKIRELTAFSKKLLKNKKASTMMICLLPLAARTFLSFCRSRSFQSFALFRRNAAYSSFQRRKQDTACRNSYCFRSENCGNCSSFIWSSVSSYGNVRRESETVNSVFKNSYEQKKFPKKSCNNALVENYRISGAYSGCFFRYKRLFAVYQKP